MILRYLLLVFLAILPGLLICWLIYKQDKHEKEEKKHLIFAFAIGVATTFFTYFLEGYLISLGFDEPTSIWKTLLVAFVFVAFAEEIMKFAGLMVYPFRGKFFNEPMDGIVYSVMIGMGFATAENLFYLWRFEETTMMLVRAFTAVPAHGAFGVIVGYFAGSAKFDKKRRWPLLIRGLVFAIFLHGLYDFFIILNKSEYLILFAILVLLISLWYAFLLVKKHEQISPFREKPEEICLEETTIEEEE